MAFRKGHQKIGGRKAGIKNKSTRAKDTLLVQLEALHLNPISIIAENFGELHPNEKINVALKLMDYVYPKKRAAIETDDDLGDLTKEELLQRGKELLSEIGDDGRDRVPESN